jgi:hypothetical protein
LARLFVANTTKQNLELGYRMIEHKHPSASYLKIPAGQQAEFPLDINSEDTNHLLAQWSGHGMVKYDEITRTDGFVGLAYRLDKPITSDQIQSGLDANQDAAQDRSEKAFAASGLGLSEIVGRRAQEEGAQLRSTEVSVQQDFDGPKPKNIVSKGVRVERQN